MITKKLLICTIALCFLLIQIGNIYAWEIDNVKSYDEEKKEITITNFLGLGSDIAKYKLTSNTDFCLINCEAQGTAELFEEGYLFTDMKFENRLGDNVNIKRYNILIEVTEETSFENPIYVDKKFSHYETVYENKTSWKLYDNKILSPGIYKWKIKGTKNMSRNDDAHQ